MTESIKLHADITGKTDVDALGTSFTALDAKLNKLAGSALKAGEASRFLEAEVRKVQKAETGRTTAVTGLTKNIDALRNELSKLGSVNGATGLKRELDNLRKEFNGFENLGSKSLDKLYQLRGRLDQALDSVSAVVSKKRGLTQGQFDPFLALTGAIDVLGKRVVEKTVRESQVIESALLASGKRQAEAATKAGLLAAQAQVAAAEVEVNALAKSRAMVDLATKTTSGAYSNIRTGKIKSGTVDAASLGDFSAQNKLAQDAKMAMHNSMVAELNALAKTETAKARAEQKAADAQKKADRKASLAELQAMADAANAAELAKHKAHLGVLNGVIAKAHADRLAIQSRTGLVSKQQLTTPASGVIPLGSYSAIGGANAGSLVLPKTDNIPKATQQVSALGSAVKQLTVHHQDLNSSLRGLAQGFGVISAGLSNMIPLVASFAVASAFVKTLKVGAEFERSMFVVSELAGTASAEMVTLRERVLQLGAATQYGPLEVAKGLEILTLAGLTAKQAIMAISTTLQFAAAGDLPLQSAAETLVAVGTAYRFGAESYSVVADVIAKTAAETMASVQAMAESFKTSSVVAQQYGVSLDDTAAALGALAQIGIKGTAAGTSFRNMITELNKGSGKAAEGVRALGVEIQELDGSMRPVMNVMRDLTKSMVTKTGAGQQRVLQDMTNERGAKALAAFQAEALAYIAKVNPGLQKQADELFAAGKILAGNKVLTDAVTDAFAKMAEKAERVKQSAQGFTFFAALEQSLTPLGQYKGILASLETDFIKAFSSSSDVVYILGARLREVFNSPEFQSGLTSLVSGIASVASGMVELTKWILEHKEAVLVLAGAYLILSTRLLQGLALDAAVGAWKKLTIGVWALTAATTGLTTGVGLVAAAKLVWASASAALTGALVSAQVAATGFWAALLGIPAAMVAIGVAIAAVVAGLGYLAYKWATAADSAEESARKQRASMAEGLKTAIEADGLKIKSTEEQIAAEISEKEKLLQAMKDGLSKEQAIERVVGEMALERIQGMHEKIMLQEAFNAAKARELVLSGPANSTKGTHAMQIAAVDKGLSEFLLAQEYKMAAELDKQIGRTYKLKTLNAEMAELARKQAEQKRLTGKDDNIGYTGKGGKGGKAAGMAASEQERAELKTALAQHEIALKQINTLKAQAEKQTAAALAAEKQALFEINAAYADGAQARIDATTSIQLAMAGADGSVLSRAEGEAKIAAIQLEGNRAELDQIRWTRDATAARYKEEVRILTVLKEQTLVKLQGALAVLKAEKAKLEPVKNQEFHKENYVKIATEVDKLSEAIVTATEDTKALDAAQQAYNDTMAKGETEFNKKLREQNNALKARQVTAQQELQTLKDTWKNRAKSTDELEAEEAVQQRLLATKLMEDARRKAAAGDITAEQAKILADTAAIKAELLEFKIAKDAAMSTDWYAAVEKALKDYASGLKNVAGEIANVFTKSFKGLEDVLTDFLTKGKADFKGFVKSILADLARIAVRQGIIGPMLGGFTSGMAGGGGGSMLGSMAGSAASSMMGGGASGGLLSGVGTTVSGWFGAGATAGGSALGAGGAASGAAELAGTVATNTAAGGSLMSGLSSAISAIPVWGWGLMAAAAIAAIAGKGESRSGGQYGYSTDGTSVANARRGTTQSASGVGATFLEGPSGGTGDVSAVSLMNSTFKGINDLFTSLGSSETVSGFQSGYESSKNSRGGVFAGGTLTSGKTFGESGKGDNYAGTLYEKTSAQTVSIEDAAKNYVTDLKQATIQAMQAATDLPKLIADKLKDLNAETMDDSALDALMGDIQNIIVSVNSFRDTLDTLPFTELRDMSFDAAAGLVQAVGGLDKLGTFTTNLSSYFENFYSEEEKRKNTVKNITGTLNKAGLAVSEDQVNTATKETFRQVVEQYAAMGTEGQDVYLALLSVNQAFSDLSTATGSFLDDLKSYTESFSTKKELRTSAVTSITEKLNKNTSGIKVTESMVSSAGIKDFRAAVEATKAMGPAGRSAYESLLSVNQEFLALGNDQIKLDALLDTYGDLGAAAEELVPPADKLVDSWRKNKSAIQDLNDALDEALGIVKETTAAEKAVAAVKKAVTDRDELKEARKGINDTIDSIRLAAAKPADKVTLLKGKEAKLREEFAANPTATLFNKLTETTLERIRAEGALRQTEQAKLDKAQADTLESQLAGLQRLKDMAGELAQFVSDLKIGDLSALSPKDQLAEAKRLYEDTLAKAKSGDTNAVSSLQGNAQQYLQEAQTYWGGATSPYAGIFGSVTSDLSTVSAAGASGAVDSQITLLTTELELLQEKMTGAVSDTSKEEIAALEALGALADGALDQMDKNIVTLTAAAEKQILLLQAIVDAQEVELTVQIAKHKELINVLDRIDDNTGESSTAAKLENAKA